MNGLSAIIVLIFLFLICTYPQLFPGTRIYLPSLIDIYPVAMASRVLSDSVL